MDNNQKKYEIVISKNTFYFFDTDFEESYENHIFFLQQTILYLRNLVKTEGCKKEVFEHFLRIKKDDGLKSLLAITGISNEGLKRLITTIRIINNEDLNALLLKNDWDYAASENEISEWNTSKIYRLVNDNDSFRKCIVNILFEGSTNKYISKMLPTFELKKFSLDKLSFDENAMIDTLARYKEKGSRAATHGNNPEIMIEKVLSDLNIPFEKGDLSRLVKDENIKKRTMDFIIPDNQKPLIIVESSYLTTTSSGQGDKSKTEISIKKLIKDNYPKAKFIGFIDGIGWYVRKSDLRRMVSAYNEVFTFHHSELERFAEFVKRIIKC